MSNYAISETKTLRIAAYPDHILLEKIDNWCKQNNRDRNGFFRHMVRTMLNIEDGSDYALLAQNVARLEALVKRLENEACAAN